MFSTACLNQEDNSSKKNSNRANIQIASSSEKATEACESGAGIEVVTWNDRNKNSEVDGSEVSSMNTEIICHGRSASSVVYLPVISQITCAQGQSGHQISFEPRIIGEAESNLYLSELETPEPIEVCDGRVGPRGTMGPRGLQGNRGLQGPRKIHL